MSGRRDRSLPPDPAAASTWPAGGPVARPEWTVWLAGAAIAAAALLAYANSFSAPFVFDDETAVVNNPAIRQLWPLSDALSPPLNSGGASGRPLVNLSFAINYALGGLNVEGYHALNLLIHIAAGLTLFGLVRRTLRQPELRERLGGAALPAAFFTALLWTVHPLLTETVTGVTQRTESLAGWCYLLTLYGLVRAAESSRPGRWQAASLTACVLGMGCKEVMVSAPLIAVFYDVAFLDGSWRAAWRRRGRFFALLALSWVPLGLLVAGHGTRYGTVGFGLGVSSWEYALTQCRAIIHYLVLSFWPHPLVVDYGEAIAKRPDEVWLQGLVLLGLLGATIAACFRKMSAAFPGLWFFAILAPSSSFLPLTTQTVAEHRMYLPLAAVLVPTVIGIHRLVGRRSWTVLTALAAALMLLTARRNEDYRNPLALWRDTVTKAPGNARAHGNLGSALADAGRQDEARLEFEEALRLKPDDAMAHYNLATALERQGRLPEAVARYRESLRLEPDSPKACNNLGNIFVRQRRWAEAGAEFAAALRLDPEYPEAHNNLGNVLITLGRPAEAVPHFEAVLRRAPEMQSVHYNLAVALANAGRAVDAVAHFQTVVRLAPERADAHFHLGLLLAEAGQRDAGIRELVEALRLKPDYDEARQNLARLGYPVGP